MSAAEPFFDTNVLLYLLSADAAKADRAESLLADGGTISVQVLNEFASVALRKLELPVAELREVLEPVRSVCQVEPVTEDTHDRALALVERYGFSLYDAMLIAAALRVLNSDAARARSDARGTSSRGITPEQAVDQAIARIE